MDVTDDMGREAVRSRPSARTYADFVELIDRPLQPSGWVVVTQQMIDKFAEATLDDQWIHVEAERAAAGPFGTTIAHGYLVLGLIPHLLRDVFDLSTMRVRINYGADRLRFPAPTPVGSRVRLHATVAAVLEVEGGARVTTRCRVERDGHDRPVCVVDVISQVMFGDG